LRTASCLNVGAFRIDLRSDGNLACPAVSSSGGAMATILQSRRLFECQIFRTWFWHSPATCNVSLMRVTCKGDISGLVPDDPSICAADGERPTLGHP
jgi:hypothetical protein